MKSLYVHQRDAQLRAITNAKAERIGQPAQDEPRCCQCDQPCLVEEIGGLLFSACCISPLPQRPL